MTRKNCVCQKSSQVSTVLVYYKFQKITWNSEFHVGLHLTSGTVQKSGKFPKSILSGKPIFSFPDGGLLTLNKIDFFSKCFFCQIHIFSVYFDYECARVHSKASTYNLQCNKILIIIRNPRQGCHT